MILKQMIECILEVDKNEYPNIFLSKSWYEQISEYIRIQNFDTNDYWNNFFFKFNTNNKYLNVPRPNSQHNMPHVSY